MLDPTLFNPRSYARFIAKVDKTEGCWLWTANIDPGGYGTFQARNHQRWYAHRWSYTYHVGPIPGGLQLDHLCRVRHCVNPAHLEPVTPRENTRRGVSAPAVNAAREACIHGHEFTPDNTIVRITKSGRQERCCKTCQYRKTRARYWERRAAGWVHRNGKLTPPEA